MTQREPGGDEPAADAQPLAHHQRQQEMPAPRQRSQLYHYPEERPIIG